MRFRFLHLADVHLGYRQYNSAERADDFALAFLHVMREAVRHRVDFVLLAGDLFHKRSIDAVTLNQAYNGLQILKNAGIPCLAVEGNHELAYYDESVGWLHFLALREMVTLLKADFHEGEIALSPYTKRKGSWLDVLPGVRVHGLRYMGAGTTKALEMYHDALAALPDEGVEYSIFMAHTGVEGAISGDVGSPSLSAWGTIRPHADYVALGHIHKPFDYQGWIYNPGSLESCSVDESEWEDRGYLLVDVDTSLPRGERHTTTLVQVPRRPILRLALKVDEFTSQEELCVACVAMAERRAADLGEGKFNRHGPIVDLLLSGVLQFDNYALHLREIEEQVRAATDALRVLLRNFTVSGIGPLLPRDELTRAEMEELVMASLFASDRKYKENSTAWAKATLEIKKLALANTPPAALLDDLERLIEQMTSPAAPAEAHPSAPAPLLATIPD